VTILLDECVPRPLRRFLSGHSVLTAQQAGLGGFKNGQLLKATEGVFDLLLTSDKNLRYQQNLTGRKLAILLLSTNNRTKLLQNGEKILSAVNRMKPGKFEELEI
jgi:predicted nuclease of predicted toxin-antitoxin system